MNIIGSILLVLLLIFTIFNLYATFTKKKRDKVNEAKYNAIFAPIDEAIMKTGKEWKGSKVSRIVTEKEQGIVAVRDDSRTRAIIGWDGGTRMFSYKEYKGSEISEGEEGISIIVRLKDESLDLKVSDGKFKPKSFVTKSLKSMAESMKSFLDEIHSLESKEMTEEKKEQE